MQEHNEFNEFLSAVVDNGHLDEPALGISKLVLDKGQEALSDKQSFVFQSKVLDEFAVDDCERCHSFIPWSEKYDAYHNGGLCSYCDHMEGKMEAE